MLRFTPIDTDRHANECVAFRADSFTASFGSPELFFAEWGEDGGRYLEHLQTRMSDLPGSCVHAWRADLLVGQVELREGREDLTEGYVDLYYLIPEMRGRGLAPQLDQYAIRWFTARGLTRAALGVSPTNARAIRFYLRQGWSDFGQHPRHPNSRLMKKAWSVEPAA
jgi:GNAT superfamily N-acetyltransferase